MPPGLKGSDLAKLRILIVADRDLQLLLVALLEELGLSRVDRALDAETAMVQVTKQSGYFDLVICRLDLAKGDGLDVLKFLRERYGKRPFLLLAATATGDTISLAQALGVDGFLAIPFNAETFKKRVVSIIAKYLARDAEPDSKASNEEDVWLI